MEIGDSPAALNSISSSFQGCEGGHFWRLSPLFALESYPGAWLRIGICQDAGLLGGAAYRRGTPKNSPQHCCRRDLVFDFPNA